MPNRPKPKQDDLSFDNSEAMNESPIPNISAEELGNHIIHIRREMSEIKTALIGNKQYGAIGLVEDLRQTKVTVAEHDKKFIIWGAILSAAGTALVFIKDYLHINKP